ncbi:UDP-glucuronic acid decarboxylase family protein [Frigidibacter sp. MR17.14]|uniref:UDP-glucuronic acid decarboxylase family protein n=1 Tax=Frigidibacter sp. MR17.14 TaxID=3126509 RepID=UPI003012AA32
MARILVTGGCGFIGSHLCQVLLDQGHHVIALDNLQTGSLGNLSAMLGNDRIEVLAGDVEEPLAAIGPVAQIYNLACPASPVQYQRDPVRTLRTSFLGALNVLDLARRCGARVLQASTSEIYGDPEVHPQTETYRGSVSSFGPRACYDEGKRAAEALFHDYARMHGVDIRIARIFNTYGPRMAVDDGRVISNFAVQALRGEPITLYGDGRQTRSFCYVEDLVRGLVALMEAGPGMRRPCNLGNPEEVTIAELAERIAGLSGLPALIEHRALPQDDPTRRRPDISLAVAHLGWRPRVTLDEGLRRTMEHFRALCAPRAPAQTAARCSAAGPLPPRRGPRLPGPAPGLVGA